MSVVGDDWDTLKRYNLAELYGTDYKKGAPNRRAEAKLKEAATDEIPRETITASDSKTGNSD